MDKKLNEIHKILIPIQLATIQYKMLKHNETQTYRITSHPS